MFLEGLPKRRPDVLLLSIVTKRKVVSISGESTKCMCVCVCLIVVGVEKRLSSYMKSRIVSKFSSC